MHEDELRLRRGYVTVDWAPEGPGVQKQIERYVRQKISSGDWAVGLKLPSQRTLARQFGVNRSTVAAALSELMALGVLESGRGGGTRIAAGGWALRVPAAPGWGAAMEEGGFRANSDIIQTINRLEFDPSYIRLGTGELSPDLYPRALSERTLARLGREICSMNYLEPLGLRSLRETLCARLNARGIAAGPENVLITSGSLQALQLISMCLLRNGSLVLTEKPSYLRSLQVFQSAGLRLRGIAMDGEGLLPSALDGNAQALYTIPTFHNPTGTVMSARRRQEVMDRCTALRLPVIEDDAYGELWLDETPPPALKTLDNGGAVLYLGTVSKTLAPGLRVGWAVGPESVVARLGDVKMQVDYGASSISQRIVEELWRGGDYDRYLLSLREALRRRRALALSALQTHFSSLADWNLPAGGFYIWLRLRQPVPTEMLFRRALSRRLLLNPGAVYDDGDNHALRLSYAYADEAALGPAIAALAEVVRGML
ncbi:MAG: PLP-dependent aminotransferase family protein [Clostridiaceae bacterium]|nr:PLP-dependent aminotransferase family protein [Clostridiaceae bacterium]